MFYLSKAKHINFVALHRAADKLVEGLPFIKKRRRLRRVYKILKYSGLAAAALLLISLILFSAEIINSREFFSQAVKGRANLEKAVIFAEQAEYGQAMVLAEAAGNNFSFLTDGLERARKNFLAKKFTFIDSQLNSLASLAAAGGFLSQAVYSGADFLKNLSGLSGVGAEPSIKLKFSLYSSAEKRLILGKIHQATPELNGIKANLSLAYLELDRLNLVGAFFPFKKEIIEMKENINSARQTLEKAVPLSQLLPALAGYPKEAKYLAVWQNSTELRPTGGFLSAYGILKFKDGDLVDFNTRDIYSLDAPVKDKIKVEPPEPLKKYLVNGWYSRDANWSPDWPTSAQKFEWFYKKSSALNPAALKITEPDGVIALTPKLITDFLKILGPVRVQGQSYDQTNFQDLLMSRAEDISLWPKKELIGQVVGELKTKIFDLPAKDWTKIINTISDNLTTKDLMFYLTDQQLENIALANGWGGDVKQTDGDYLMVVDANLGGEENDRQINRGLEYKVSQGPNGLFSKLTLNYAYHGGADRKNGVYKSYTRIYAPLGSQLISSSGHEIKKIEVGSELSKTWFGIYFEVMPENIKNLTIEYKLPALVLAPKNYELYLQKQPGKEINEAIVDLSFLNDIKSYSPASLATEKVNSVKIRWEGDLNIDRSFEVKF